MERDKQRTEGYVLGLGRRTPGGRLQRISPWQLLECPETGSDTDQPWIVDSRRQEFISIQQQHTQSYVVVPPSGVATLGGTRYGSWWCHPIESEKQ
ncbi:hypothetical protein J6590_031131 [Homalodisca vitripennis]|nr:hypothetical protein J6590_031131 [Homalodisca vitripennis]